MWQTAARIPVPRSLNPCPFAVPRAAWPASCWRRCSFRGWPRRPAPASAWWPPATRSTPYLWRDPQDPKRLIGANADLLQRLGKELGVRIDVLYSGSWEKAQEEVTSGRADLLAGAYLTWHGSAAWTMCIRRS